MEGILSFLRCVPNFSIHPSLGLCNFVHKERNAGQSLNAIKKTSPTIEFYNSREK